MLIPLQTLPGWPKVESPSALEVLGLLVGAPLVVIALVAVAARVHHAVKGNMGTPSVGIQPVWVNGRRIEPATQDEWSQSAIGAGYEAVAKRAQQSDDEDREREDADQPVVAARAVEDHGDQVGGAGARW